LRATLRHRPHRIIAGAVRGGEAFDLLQALNTGHAGTLSTIHANSAGQALTRLASCALQSGVDLPYQAIRQQIADAIHVVVHLGRRDRRRYVHELIRVGHYTVLTTGTNLTFCSPTMFTRPERFASALDSRGRHLAARTARRLPPGIARASAASG